LTEREKPVGGVVVKVCAASGVAFTVIVLRELQNDPASTLGGAARSLRSKPVLTSMSTPSAKVEPVPDTIPPTHIDGTLPVTVKFLVSVALCADAVPAQDKAASAVSPNSRCCMLITSLRLKVPGRASR
jgi:hypothetical protein